MNAQAIPRNANATGQTVADAESADRAGLRNETTTVEPREAITYSRGFGQYDNTPGQRTAPDFAAFREAIMADRATAKGQQWIAGAFAPDAALRNQPHRCKACALPRRWLGLDCDGATPNAFNAAALYLQRYSGLIYTTASATKEAPRFRIVVELDRAGARDEIKAASCAFRARIDAALAEEGHALQWDASCDRPEQPLYLPPTGAQTYPMKGEPAKLSELLADVPAQAAQEAPQAAPVVPSQQPTRYALGALEKATRAIANAPEGERNEVLNREAYSMGGLIATGQLLESVVEAALFDATRRAGYATPAADMQKISDGIRAGMAHPRTDGLPSAPEPLVVPTEPEPYPLDALPPPIRRAVTEVQAFVQAPMPLVASAALAALSVAGQSLLDVKRAERLSGPCNLYLLTVADSGERKTTCDGFFTGAIRAFEAEQAEAAKPVLKDYRANLSAWESTQAGVKDALRAASKKGAAIHDLQSKLAKLEAEKPEAPHVPKLMHGDETPEHLAWLLAKDWPSGAVVSSEAGVVLGAHGMGKDSVMRNLALLNVLWDGGVLAIGRKTSESFEVRGARLTMALQVQEATLRAFFEQSGALARGTGFLARFLIAWPQSTQGQRAFKEAPKDWPALAAFNARLGMLLRQPQPLTDDGTLEPSMAAFTPEAKAAWVAFHNAIEAELRTGGELHDVRDVASKVADNAARLAALFHLFAGTAGAISVECFEGAARVAAWHLSEARRFFGELALAQELADAVQLERWLLAYCRERGTDAAPRRDAQQYGQVRQGNRLDTALFVLADLNRAHARTEGRRKLIAPHPMLLRESAP